MKKYILRNGEYYLADLSYDYEQRELKNIVLDRDFKKIYEDFDYAEEDRKLIFIEIGLELKVEEYETKDN